MVTPAKWQQLRTLLSELNITEEELEEKFILGSGKGGQKVNKTASCVFLLHKPSGLRVKCQQTRSRETNRYYARKRLCEKLQTEILKEKTQKQRELEKIRQQKRRRSRRAKEKILADKQHQAEIKGRRKKPQIDETR